MTIRLVVDQATRECLEYCQQLMQALRERTEQVNAFDQESIDMLEQTDFLKGVTSSVQSHTDRLQEIAKVQQDLDTAVAKGEKHVVLRTQELDQVTEHNKRLRHKLEQPPKDSFICFLEQLGDKCGRYLSQEKHGS